MLCNHVRKYANTVDISAKRSSLQISTLDLLTTYFHPCWLDRSYRIILVSLMVSLLSCTSFKSVLKRSRIYQVSFSSSHSSDYHRQSLRQRISQKANQSSLAVDPCFQYTIAVEQKFSPTARHSSASDLVFFPCLSSSASSCVVFA